MISLVSDILAHGMNGLYSYYLQSMWICQFKHLCFNKITDSHHPVWLFNNSAPCGVRVAWWPINHWSQLYTETTGCNPEADFSIKLRVINLVEVSTHQLYLAAIVLSAVVKWSKTLGYSFIVNIFFNNNNNSDQLFWSCQQFWWILMNNFTSYAFLINFFDGLHPCRFNSYYCCSCCTENCFSPTQLVVARQIS